MHHKRTDKIRRAVSSTVAKPADPAKRARVVKAVANAPVKRRVSAATAASLKKIDARYGKALDNLAKR